MAKDTIQDILIKKGRELALKNGASALTARKLSELSGYSVGTIYNQFGNMEGYILLQNYITLEDLFIFMNKVPENDNPYILLNSYLDAFITYVLNNKNFWSLLFDFHLKNSSKTLSGIYLRKIYMILRLLNKPFGDLCQLKSKKERNLLLNTLWTALFSLSSFLATNQSPNYTLANKKIICKIFLNTYLAGVLILPEN